MPDCSTVDTPTDDRDLLLGITRKKDFSPQEIIVVATPAAVNGSTGSVYGFIHIELLLEQLSRRTEANRVLVAAQIFLIARH